MVIGKKFVITRHFKGEPKPGDLSLIDFELPAIKDGEILVETEYLSVDPYMRPYSRQIAIGEIMIGSQVARITESRNPGFPVGKRLIGYFGWTSHAVVNPDQPSDNLFKPKPYLLPAAMDDLPASLMLGVLGMPGNTAYFGFLEICKPKPGECVVVSGAAGAVGSHVGQLAKIHGLRVIGLAGTSDKCNWLLNEFGFDAAINYRVDDVAACLKKAAPDGVDCYFDNVGGELSSTVIGQMKEFGRVSVCGSISCYNDEENSPAKASILQPAIVFKQLRIEGFIAYRWADRWQEGIERNAAWIREGKLRYRETVTQGFENAFDAFVGMLKGENTGKALVKV